MHLRFSMKSAYDLGVCKHPQVIMQELGIRYELATPQSMGDQWWFWNCSGGASVLPDYITQLDLNPMSCIGFGLSETAARTLASDIELATYIPRAIQKLPKVEDRHQVRGKPLLYDAMNVSLVVCGKVVRGYASGEVLTIESE